MFKEMAWKKKQKQLKAAAEASGAAPAPGKFAGVLHTVKEEQEHFRVASLGLLGPAPLLALPRALYHVVLVRNAAAAHLQLERRERQIDSPCGGREVDGVGEVAGKELRVLDLGPHGGVHGGCRAHGRLAVGAVLCCWNYGVPLSFWQIDLC